jgi:hypothetical protein
VPTSYNRVPVLTDGGAGAAACEPASELASPDEKLLPAVIRVAVASRERLRPPPAGSRAATGH